MSLAQYLTCLSTEHLKQLNDDLVESGIAFSLKGDHKAVFRKRKKESSGKRKKLYSALCKASPQECSRMADRVIECYPILTKAKEAISTQYLSETQRQIC